MRLFDETGWVRDSDGVKWECRWQRLDGYPMPKITRVLLRPPGSNIDTHFMTAGWTADACLTFQTSCIKLLGCPAPSRRGAVGRVH